MPSLLIASMPRSASASLVSTLSETLGMPVLRVSAGRFPRWMIVKEWLNNLTAGGAVLHDHFGANEMNLRILGECGVREVFVQIRDPRAAAASFIKFRDAESMPVLMPGELKARISEAYFEAYVPWLKAWFEQARRLDGQTRVKWIDSARVRCDCRRLVAEMLEALPEHPSALKVAIANFTERRANFQQGDDNAWRAVFNEREQSRMWEALGEPLADFLASFLKINP